eukprot:SAG31_NODE_271_length_18717_cov_8.685949_6_plen_228_part_00
MPTYDLKIVLQHALSPAIRKCLAGTTAGGRTFPGDGSAMDVSACKLQLQTCVHPISLPSFYYDFTQWLDLQVQISWKYDGLQDAYDLSKACSKRSHNHPAKRQRGNNGSSNWKNNQVDTSWPCAIGCELETPLKAGFLCSHFELTSWHLVRFITKLLSSVDNRLLQNCCRFPPLPLEACQNQPWFTVDIRRPSLFVAGRYKKFQRGLSQTPWQYGAHLLRWLWLIRR